MPQPQLSPQERRLAVFCRIFAAVYFLGALGFAAFPSLIFRLVTFDRVDPGFTAQAMFWNVLAVAMMTAIASACAVTAGRPRERRHALLPVVIAKLTSSVLALVYLGRGYGQAAAAIIVTDFPLFVLTTFVYRSAAPGVHSEPAREGPPADAPQPPQKIQLGIKAN